MVNCCYESNINGTKWLVFKGCYVDEFTDDIIEILKGYTHVRLPKKYNNPIDNLPDNITDLEINYNFKRDINRYPEELKRIYYGTSFNSSIDNLPDTVTTIIFNYHYSVFNIEIKKLPLLLEEIYLSYRYNKSLDSMKNLQYLKKVTLCNFRYKNLNFLPDTVNFLRITDYNFNHYIEFPDNIEYLDLIECSKFNKPIKAPQKLKYLSLGWKYNMRLDELPEGFLELIFNYNSVFNKSLDKLPSTTKKIIFGWYFNKSLNNLPNIKHLELSVFFNQPLDFLPNSLKILKILNDEYTHPLYNLPTSIETFHISNFYKHMDTLPPNLHP